MLGKTIKTVLIPHLEKVKVKNLPPKADPLDPPLTEKAMVEVGPLTDRLVKETGEPGLIMSSPRIRCHQTAAEAVRRFGGYHGLDVPVVELSDLARADNSEWCKADEIPVGYPYPARRKEGSNTYHVWGPETDESEWLWSAWRMYFIIRAFCEAMDIERPIWVFSHGPIVAAWKWIDKNPEWEGPVVLGPDSEGPPPYGSIILRDTTLHPFLIIDL